MGIALGSASSACLSPLHSACAHCSAVIGDGWVKEARQCSCCSRGLEEEEDYIYWHRFSVESQLLGQYANPALSKAAKAFRCEDRDPGYVASWLGEHLIRIRP